MLDELSTLDRWPPAPRVPTLIVHGRRDRMAPVGASRRLAAVSPTVRLLEVDDGHHLRRVWPEALLATERFLSPWLRCEPSDENEAQAEPHAR
jgi:pimeloyl-ACP methyl ester carboxylesterase